MAEMNVYVDGTALDNGSTRKIFGQINVTETTGGGFALYCSVLLSAASTSALQALWDTTKASFNGRDSHVVATLDSAASPALEDISPLDGKHDNILASVQIDLSKENTDTSMWVVFSVTADTPDIDSSTGQVGDIVCQKAYDPANIQSRSAEGAFLTTFNAGATTGLTLSSVSNSGGKAVFNVASGAPTFVVGMRLKAIGTTNYQSPSEWHLITGITGQAITTDTTFVATDTGTVDVGAATSGLANYNAQEATIFQNCLGTESDGSRSSSTGLAVTTRSISTTDDDNFCQFLISSDWMEADLSGVMSDSARKMELRIDTAEPEQWQDVGGTRPTIISVVGAVTFDKEALGRSVKNSDWNSIKSVIETQIKTRSGKGSIKRMNLTLSAAASNGTLAFNATYIADNFVHFQYNQVDQEEETARFIDWTDSDGYHRIQEAPGPRDAVYIIVVNRIGPGIVDIEPLLPVRGLADPTTAYDYRLINKNVSQQGPVKYDDFTDVYLQNGTFTYKRFRTKPGFSSQFLRPGIV